MYTCSSAVKGCETRSFSREWNRGILVMALLSSGALAGAAAADANDAGEASIVEVIALDRLVASLRHAHHYVLTVATQRYPVLLWLHGLREELFVVLAAALDLFHLSRNRASFCEHFYALRRQATGDASPSRPLAALLPLLAAYVRAKAESHPLLRAALDGQRGDEQGVDGIDGSPPPDAPASASENANLGQSPTQARWRSTLAALFRAGCTAVDALSLGQLVLFMYGRSKYATLGQRLLGYTLRRQGLESPDQAGAAGGMPAHTVFERGIGLLEGTLQRMRQLLLLSVFGYRLLEWWHAPESAPPPPLRLFPPPPAPPPSLRPGWPPAGRCGLCGMVPLEPTATPSGYVLCLRCAKLSVRSRGQCPVTGMPMGLDDLRGLYETSRPPPRAAEATTIPHE